ncbi:MAG: DUF115 domain-containing protein [Treponema sp.]|jgi:hypothetical protein|nr:DUF115 domain-containing protein [Treponema sp.]
MKGRGLEKMDRFLNANLQALAKTDPALSARLAAAAHLHRYGFVRSRSGEPIPTLAAPSGGVRPLHSLVDPVREGRRLISTVKDAGFLVFFGLGGGFAITAALEREDIQHILVIDYDINGVAELLDSKPYPGLWQDPRVHILVDPPPELIKGYILEHYQPVLYRGIQVIPLRIRIDAEPERFSAAGEGINEAITRISGDYSVQAHFGARWFSNILRNLLRMKPVPDPLPALNQAAICAAGPSLDIQLPGLAKKRRHCFLLATDTSLPSLLHAGLVPDAVVSIDCQHISYYHFMQGLPGHIPLYLDVASPPVVASQVLHPRFFSGGHPLTRYVSQYWRPLPLVDTSGGNVTYAALSLADCLGAKQVELYGADFAYPLGRTYARGTYLYPFFDARQTRLAPLETLWSALLYRSPELKRIQPGDAWYYETPTLSRYRRLLEEKIPFLRAQVIPAEGLGAPLRIRKQQEALPPGQEGRFLKASMPVQDFIAAYRKKICSLPALTGTVQTYLQGLTETQGPVLTTLLPLAAAIQHRTPFLGPGELIEAVRDACVKKIDALLGRI